MVSLAVVMPHVLRDRPSQVPLSQWHHALQTLGLYGKNKSLGVGVQIWAPRWQAHYAHACCLQHPSERCRVQRIPVEDQIPLPSQKSVLNVQQISCHLLHPPPVWISADPNDLHRPAPDVDREKHVVPDKSEQGHHLDGEEVHPHDGTRGVP